MVTSSAFDIFSYKDQGYVYFVSPFKFGLVGAQ